MFFLLRVKRDFNKRPASLALEQTKDPQEENGPNKAWSPPHLLGTLPATSGQELPANAGRELLTVVLTSPHLTHLRKMCTKAFGRRQRDRHGESRVSWDGVSPLVNCVALSEPLPQSLHRVIHLRWEGHTREALLSLSIGTILLLHTAFILKGIFRCRFIFPLILTTLWQMGKWTLTWAMTAWGSSELANLRKRSEFPHLIEEGAGIEPGSNEWERIRSNQISEAFQWRSESAHPISSRPPARA